LKTAVRSFFICCHLCSKSAIGVICRFINFTWVVLQHPQHSTARTVNGMNTMFEETEAVSHCRCGYWHSESQIILFGSMNNFHWKMSSELVRNIHYCSGSDIAVNHAD